MKYGLLAFIFILLTPFSWTQITLNTIGVPYTENFSGLTYNPANAGTQAWTNNTTLAGWYAAHAGTFNLMTQLSGSTRNNTGRLYTVIDGTDVSLGSRASGGTATITYGVRLRNSTGVTINSLYVTYTGEQWSIAENSGNSNNIAVSYQVGATVTSTTAGTWTSAPSLDFTQIYTSTDSPGMGGTACGGSSAQCLSLNGNTPANQRQITFCLDVVIPNGQEILIRWVDVDDAANDHHMQIDDLSITPYEDICSVVLPLGWGPIAINQNGESTAKLDWTTFNERNNDHFNVQIYDQNQHDFKTVSSIESKGDSESNTNYTLELNSLLPDNYVGRIEQIDTDGKRSHSPIFQWEMKSENRLFYYEERQLKCSENLPSGSIIQIVDLTGRVIRTIEIQSETKIISSEELPIGILIIQVLERGKSSSQKIVISN